MIDSLSDSALTSVGNVGTMGADIMMRTVLVMPMPMLSSHIRPMNSPKKAAICSIVLMTMLCLVAAVISVPLSVQAEELDMINRPVNSDGMTGLLVTTIPFTLPKKTVEIGAAVITENSHVPDFTLATYPVLVAYGLSDNSELAVRGSYVTLDTAGTATAGTVKSRGAGDTTVSYKWNFRKQHENSIAPAISLFLTGILPTGDREAGTNTVDHWGARLGISAGSEIPIEDYTLGVYADAQLVVQDLSDDSARDRKQLFNAGILLPISKYRNLQMLVEYNTMGGQDVSHLFETNFSAVTYGIRLVSERFNLTFGAQFIHRTATGHEDSTKVFSMMSYKI